MRAFISRHRAVGILTGSLMIVVAAAFYAHQSVSHELESHFHTHTQEIEKELKGRMQAYLNAFIHARGLFAAQEAVSRTEFRRFVEGMELFERYPGILGLGFNKRISADQIGQHEKAMRKTGLPTYNVWPQSNNASERFPITFIEPRSKLNQKAFGYDTSSEPIRREAMERARDTGKPATSGKLILVQEGDSPEWGFIIFTPVYQRGVPIQTVAQRRNALIGYVSAPFRASNLFNSVFSTLRSMPIEYQIYDAPHASREHRLYSSSTGSPRDNVFRPSIFRLSTHSQFDVGGRTWTIELRSLPQAAGFLSRLLPLVLLMLGSTISWLIYRSLKAGEERIQLERSLLQREQEARKEAECSARLLRDTTEKLQSIIKSSPFAILTLDSMAHVQSWNPAATRIFGWDEREVLHREIPVVPEEDRPEFLQLISLSRSGQTIGPVEVRRVRKDGSYVPVRVTAAPLHDEQGGVQCVLSIIEDITHSKTLEKQLRHSERLAAIGTLAAGIAHEINNPLTYVITNLELLLESLENSEVLPAERRAQLETVLRGCDRMRNVVGSLKMFARMDENSELKAIDVHAALESSIGIASNEIRHRAQLVRDYGDISEVVGDEGRLGQVFLNLLINAAQAIPEGKATENIITIRTRTLESGEIAVEVSDTGTGISRENLPHVFDPFFTTKPVGVGTGLGLSICHGIVNALGGRIEVESRQGHGTTFRVVLRPASVTLKKTAKQEITSSMRTHSRRQLLIVDDERDIVDSLALVLKNDYDVVTATDARSALRLLEAASDYALILCDLMMPETTGMDLYEAVRQRHPGLEKRFVFMTGGAFTPRSQEFLRQVQVRILEKPFTTKSVRGLIHEFITT